MKEKIKTKKILEIELTIAPILKERGFILIDVEVTDDSNDTLVTLYLYNADDTSVENLGKINKSLYPILEKIPFLGDRFSLEVSSPGLYRDIKSSFEFSIFKGREIRVICEDGIVITGVIGGFENNNLTVILPTRETITINFENIKKASLNG